MSEGLSLTSHRFEAAIIGGGVSGCLAAVKLAGLGHKVALIEKAHVVRSGCLAAGVNALNAYVGRGHTPEDYVAYAVADAHQIARTDLLLSMARRLNDQASWLESLGLGIHKDAKGLWLERGWRNLRVNGENLKPLLAAAVAEAGLVTVFERAMATHLLVRNNTVLGLLALQAVGDSGLGEIISIETPAILITTGGASGLYRTAAGVSSGGNTWYSPFNAGGGLAMGIRAGAEMTTLEMRFVALRCCETMAPTGTLALGAGASQVNSLGELYEGNYGLTTSQRVWAARSETRAGRSPCYLAAEIDRAALGDLQKAYLNMCPSQTLKFLEQEMAGDEGTPTPDDLLRLQVEIRASEPYVQGGHTAGGFWVDTDRRTTVSGLWAAGDAAGLAPQKYVTGAMAEAEIAALDISRRLSVGELTPDLDISPDRPFERQAREAACQLRRLVSREKALFSPNDIEEALWRTMDLYAGGVGADYRYGLAGLAEAEARLEGLIELADGLTVLNYAGLVRLWETMDRLVVARSLVAHLRARRETRWPGFGEYDDYPEIDDNYLLYINSVLSADGVRIIERPLVKGERYGHQDR
jgi:adenylylsulfate reductase subunit A